jgi:predicted unusual protein kinase regulating ubiquinone biosynthesis (AarF/ABC1/UbiB family)
MRDAILALLQKDPQTFVDRMESLRMIAPGARREVERRVGAMFERVAGRGGALALSGGQVLDIKDEAKRLLVETPGLQLPNDLLLYAKTLSYLFALCERLAPDADVMKLSVPYLLRFLAGREATGGGG